MDDYIREAVIRIMSNVKSEMPTPETEIVDARERLAFMPAATSEWERALLDRTSSYLSTTQQEDLSAELAKLRKQLDLRMQMMELRQTTKKDP